MFLFLASLVNIAYAATVLAAIWFQHPELEPRLHQLLFYSVLEKFIAIFVAFGAHL
jgi:hypothetical protein